MPDFLDKSSFKNTGFPTRTMYFQQPPCLFVRTKQRLTGTESGKKKDRNEFLRLAVLPKCEIPPQPFNRA